MTVTRADIVAKATSFYGVPWKHLGRSRKGVDCIGLVIAVAEELGLTPPDLEVPVYRRQPDGTLLSYFDRFMARCSLGDISAGTVVIFSFYGSPYHAGIVTDAASRAIVHSFAVQRKVVPDLLDNTTGGRKLVRAYDYKGLCNG